MAKLSVEKAMRRAKSHARKGEIDQAKALYNAILEAFPNNIRAKQAVKKLDAQLPVTTEIKPPPQEQIDALLALYNQGKFVRTVEQAEKLTQEYPISFMLWNLYGAASSAIGDLEKAERCFRKASEINPNRPDGHNNLGIALQHQGKLDQAIASYQHALAIKPDHADTRNNLGNALQHQGKLDEAIASYQHALKVEPDNADAHNNLGTALKEQSKLDQAIASYQRALAIKPNHADAHNNMGNALKDQGKLDQAIASYQRALAIKPDHAEAHNNMGNALKGQGKLDQAIASYQRALAIKPDYAEAHNNMGNALKGQGKFDQAIVSYQRALMIRPDYAEAHNNMGSALQNKGKLDEAIASYQRALKIKTDFEAAEAEMLHQQQHICDFSIEAMLSDTSERLGTTKKAVTPFAALSWVDDPEQHLARSQTWASEKYKHKPLPLPAPPKSRPKRLKLGYFSADFHDHATMYLMAGLLRDHDRERFELFAYSYGRSKSGDWHKRIEDNVDQFFGVMDCSDREIADLARCHGLDIAVDLKGYTKDTRSGIFQYRLAPVQINYLGYPGSMGADFIDYIIADPVVISEDQRAFYSEKIIYLPHSYQPNDNAREIADTNTIRADFGLPEDAFVFCCFNNNYKISPREFDIWMRLLSKVEGSVIWLLRPNRWAEQNLRQEAEKRGIDSSRLVFAEKFPHPEHLARHKHADLFIDTFNVNAHTTASDALWAGLPVVTKQGKQFAARVAASLLTAVELPELITETEDDYESLILELATDRDRLARVKEKLAANRLKAPLFDTKRYTRNFEHGLSQVYDLYFRDKQPQNIWINESH